MHCDASLKWHLNGSLNLKTNSMDRAEGRSVMSRGKDWCKDLKEGTGDLCASRSQEVEWRDQMRQELVGHGFHSRCKGESSAHQA